MNIVLDIPLETHHVEFLKWSKIATSEQILDALVCGYNIISSGVLEKCVQKNDDFVDLQKEHEEYVSRLRIKYEKEIQMCRDKMQDLTDHWLSKWEVLIKESHTKGQDMCEQWIVRYENVNKEYTNYIKSYVDNSKENEIQELKAQLAVFQSSNAYKGEAGEKSIREVLSKNFLGYEIKDTSAQQGMSDIHLVDQDGSMIAIESKNKIVVNAQDINKSLSDIKSIKTKHGEKFVGYLFVSMKSNNIPKKGDLYFEMVENIPVIWYGTNDVTTFETDLVKLVKLLYMHKAYHIDVNEMSNRINEYLKKITDTKKSIDALNTSITCMKTNIGVLQNTLDWIYSDMLSVTGTTSLHVYICPHCDQRYKRKGDMERHVTTKHKSVLPC